jgi:hypothetical protein
MRVGSGMRDITNVCLPLYPPFLFFPLLSYQTFFFGPPRTLIRSQNAKLIRPVITQIDSFNASHPKFHSQGTFYPTIWKTLVSLVPPPKLSRKLAIKLTVKNLVKANVKVPKLMDAYVRR